MYHFVVEIYGFLVQTSNADREADSVFEFHLGGGSRDKICSFGCVFMSSRSTSPSVLGISEATVSHFLWPMESSRLTSPSLLGISEATVSISVADGVISADVAEIDGRKVEERCDFTPILQSMFVPAPPNGHQSSAVLSTRPYISLLRNIHFIFLILFSSSMKCLGSPRSNSRRGPLRMQR